MLLREALLADHRVDVAGAVVAELDATALELADDARQILRGADDGAGLRVRHQAAAAEDPAEATDLAHLVGHRDCGVELEPAAVDLLDEVVAAGVVGAGLERDPLAFAGGEDENADALAGAVRQNDGRADGLVGLARIDAEPRVDLDGLVEVGVGDLLDQRDRFSALYSAVSSTFLIASRYFLPCRASDSSSWCKRRVTRLPPNLAGV